MAVSDRVGFIHAHKKHGPITGARCDNMVASSLGFNPTITDLYESRAPVALTTDNAG